MSSPDWPTALSDSSPDFKGAPHACPALQCALLVSQGEGIVCPQPECMCQACRGSQPSSFCHLQCSSCCEQHHSGWWLLCSGNVVKIALPTSQGHSAWRAVLTAHRLLDNGIQHETGFAQSTAMAESIPAKFAGATASSAHAGASLLTQLPWQLLPIAAGSAAAGSDRPAAAHQPACQALPLCCPPSAAASMHHAKPWTLLCRLLGEA